VPWHHPAHVTTDSIPLTLDVLLTSFVLLFSIPKCVFQLRNAWGQQKHVSALGRRRRCILCKQTKLLVFAAQVALPSNVTHTLMTDAKPASTMAHSVLLPSMCCPCMTPPKARCSRRLSSDLCKWSSRVGTFKAHCQLARKALKEACASGQADQALTMRETCCDTVKPMRSSCSRWAPPSSTPSL